MNTTLNVTATAGIVCLVCLLMFIRNSLAFFSEVHRNIQSDSVGCDDSRTIGEFFLGFAKHSIFLLIVITTCVWIATLGSWIEYAIPYLFHPLKTRANLIIHGSILSVPLVSTWLCHKVINHLLGIWKAYKESDPWYTRNTLGIPRALLAPPEPVK